MDILNLADIAAVPVIVVIAYLAAECAKLTPLPDNWLPALCGLVGGILGVVALYVSPGLIPATDILTAIAIGVVSGFAATGIHQVGKQFSKMSDTTTDQTQEKQVAQALDNTATDSNQDTVMRWIKDQDAKAERLQAERDAEQAADGGKH